MSTTTITTILVCAAIFTLVAASFIDARKAKRSKKKRTAESWGKEPVEKYKNEDLQSIASYFLNLKREHKSGFTIDDITWRDLDMDEIFMRLNSTGSSVGEETLYRLLREPSFEPEVLKARQKLIAFFQNNPADRLKIQTILYNLGKNRLINLTDYFSSREPRRQWKSNLYKFLSTVAVLSPVILFFNTGVGVLLILLSFATNMVVYYSAQSEIGPDLGALNYLVRIVRCTRQLLDANITGLGELNDKLKTCFTKIRKIESKGFFLFFTGGGSLADVLGEYIKIILLKELIDYEYLLDTVSRHREELIEVYDIIGIIDSLISVASYRESVSAYTIPDLVQYSPAHARHLEFEGIYHPLIKNPVQNSLLMHRPVLVTGSNASGKSTLLKTVAVNAIFAQSICTCLAQKYSSCFYTVFTSMALRDNVRDGESYFVAEVRSIKRILDHLNDQVPCLCLIDEVLRGTNTVERIAASSQVLLYLAKSNCLCMAATHDIELTYILEDYYQNVHFQETIVDDRIVFDYMLYDGRAMSSNAIRLLRLMGYDEAIVREAENRAGLFMSQGNWKGILSPECGSKPPS